jgi:hypothetical protein
VRRSYSFSSETGEKCERVAFRFEPKKNLSKFIKFKSFVFSFETEKKMLAFRISLRTEKNVAKLAHPSQSVSERSTGYVVFVLLHLWGGAEIL